MNENKTKIAGILYKHGENDFSIWFPELTESENKEINSFLENFVNGGCSLRGSKQDVFDEIKDHLK